MWTVSLPASSPNGSVLLQALAYVGVIEVQWTKVSHHQCWSCFSCMHAAPGCLCRQAVWANSAVSYLKSLYLHENSSVALSGRWQNLLRWWSAGGFRCLQGTECSRE